MRIAYLDAFSGISGDMTIGAFLDLGMPLAVLEQGLAALGIGGYRLEVGRRVRSGISAAKFTVHLEGDERAAHAGEAAAQRVGAHSHVAPPEHPAHHAHEHAHEHGHAGVPSAAEASHAAHGRAAEAHAHGGAHAHRHYREIRALLDRAPLAPAVRERAQRVFRALALAEGRVHAMPADDVAFHEVGAIDAIVDIVGAALCLEYFGVKEVYASPLPLGSGFARSQHGVIPVPPPAAVELLRGFPVRFEDGAKELVTPTGAAIVAALATPGGAPALRPVAVGYGAGDRELADRPNLLRVVLAEPLARTAATAGASGADGLERDEMVVLEANIDDMNPEFYEAALDALLAAGARDVSLSPLTMKRGRPATLVRVIAAPQDRETLCAILLRETSTIGVRSYAVSRVMLPRTRRLVRTAHGAIAVKVVTLPDGTTRTTPEYEDCRRAARERGLPVAVVYASALEAAGHTADAPPDAAGAYEHSDE